METWRFNVEKIREENILLFVFEQEWFQEDITELKKIILSKMENVAIIEHVKGADREDIRFSWCGAYFSLRFEYYSQSCWIETESSTDILILDPLHALYQL